MSDVTSGGKDTPGNAWVYDMRTETQTLLQIKLKFVIFPGATFGPARNRAYFGPEVPLSRGKRTKKKRKEKKRNLNYTPIN